MSTLLQLLGHIASGLNVIAFAALTAGIFLSIGDFLFPYSWAIGAFCQDYAPFAWHVTLWGFGLLVPTFLLFQLLVFLSAKD